jgi:hypothetical protein
MVGERYVASPALESARGGNAVCADEGILDGSPLPRRNQNSAARLANTIGDGSISNRGAPAASFRM